MATVTARLVELDGSGAAERQLELVRRARGGGEVLARSGEPSDADGWCSVDLDDTLLARLAAGRTSGIALRIADRDGTTTELEAAQVDWAGDVVVRLPSDGADGRSRQVAGRVLVLGGRPLTGVLVRAYDADLGEAVPLGEAGAADGGSFTVRYDDEPLRAAGKLDADLVVRVVAVDGAGRVAGEARLPQAPPDARLDLSVRVVTEYEDLHAAVAGALDGRELADIRNADIRALAERAQVGVTRLRVLVAAARLEAETGLAEVVAYGVGRRDLPLAPARLVGVGADDLRRALAEAVDAAIIPVPAEGDLEAAVARLAALRGLHAPLAEIAEEIGLRPDSALLSRLADRGVRSLADVRTAGGIAHEAELAGTDEAAAQVLDAHARLSVLGADLAGVRALSEAGFASLDEIARTPEASFAAALDGRLEAGAARDLHAAAEVQGAVLGHVLAAARVSPGAIPAGTQLARFLPPSCGEAPCGQADSPLAYLADLLDYAVRHLRSNGAPVTLSALQARVRQPLAELPAACSALETPVRQVRIAIEALRGVVPANVAGYTPPAVLEVAYTSLLERVGTSLAELRLARSWRAAEQRALADRLGLTTEGRPPADALAELERDPDDPQSLTEEFLDEWFGLRDTRRPPLDPDLPPRLLLERTEWLRRRWLEEDWPAQAPSDALPIVDPDLVGPADMVYAVLTPLGFGPRAPVMPVHLWEDRTAELNTWLFELQEWRTALPTEQAVMEAFITAKAFSVLNNRDVPLYTGIGMPLGLFEDLRTRLHAGDDLTPELAPRHLDTDGFAVLVLVWDLVVQTPPGTVTDGEWRDVYDILIARRKATVIGAWRAQEQPLGIHLGPQLFRPRDPAVPWWPRRWRAPAERRRAWTSTLRSRTGRHDQLAGALRQAVSPVEEEVLGEIRDQLVRLVPMPGVPNLLARRDLLADRLGLDLQESAARFTSRIEQAIETVQGLLFGVRTGLVEDASLELDAPSFDDEWRWIGSYATWAAAMRVYLYPETALRPTLRRRQSPAFRALVDALRDAGWQPGGAALDAAVARYEDYFADVLSLTTAALCQTAGLLRRPAGTAAPSSADAGDVLAIARAAAGGRFYFSAWTRRPGWGLSGAPDQSLWAEVRLVPADRTASASGALTIAGVLPFEVRPGATGVALYALARDDDGGELHFCTRYDGVNWTAPEQSGGRSALVCAARTDAIVRAVPGGDGSTWTVRPDDAHVALDVDGSGRSRVLALSAPLADGTRRVALLRALGAGLTTERIDILAAGWRPAPGPRPVVVRVRLNRPPWSMERLVVVNPGTSEIGLLGVQPSGALGVLAFAAAGLQVDTSATFVAADVDGDGDTEILAFGYSQTFGTTEHGTANTAMPLTTVTVLDATEAALTQRVRQELHVAGNVFGAPVSDRWEGFEPVRERGTTGTVQTALIIRATHQYFTGAGNPDFTARWIAVLLWNPLTGTFAAITPTSNVAPGLHTTVGGWTWNLGDRFLGVDLGGGAQGIIVARTIDTETDPPAVAVLARQPNGQLRGLWRTDREIPAAPGAAPWSRRVGERFVDVDMDGDGVRETVIVGTFPDRAAVLRWRSGRLEVDWSVDERVLGPGRGDAGWPLSYDSYYLPLDLDGDGCEELLAVRPGERLGVLRGMAPPVSRAFSGQAVPARYGPRGVRDTRISPPRAPAEREQRRTVVRDAYLANTAPGAEPDQLYLDEAYLFAPLEIGIRLREGGDYTSALDWLRSLYDFRLPLASRAIAYRLVLDAAAPSGALTRPEAWLQGPLDPHAIAAARPRSVTRFTILAIVRCLLDFADAEFSRATVESLPRARELYLEALELLGLDVLRREPDACAGLIGELEIDIGDGELRWLWEDLLERLGGLGLEPLRAAVERLQPILEADAPLRDKLARAQQVAAEHRSEPEGRRFEDLLADRSGRRHAESALLADPAVVRQVLRLGGTVIGRGGIRRLEFVPAPSMHFAVPPNPVVEAARAYAESNLLKLRRGRNIAGLPLTLELYAAPVAGLTLADLGDGSRLPVPGGPALPPLPYRYPILVGRAKELLGLAQQAESSLLAALQSRDQASYEVLRARQDLESAGASVQMKSLQVAEASDAVTLSELQRDRAELQRAEYARLLKQDVTTLEMTTLGLMGAAAVFQGVSATSSFAAAAQAGWSIEAFFSSWSKATGELAQAFSTLAAAASTTAQITSTLASYDRRRQDWRAQEELAAQDVRIGAQQVVLSTDRVRIAAQDRAIAATQVRHAESMLEFIDTGKFGSFALYDWMSGVLGQVHRFFLQEATAMARLAEAQLAFERQRIPATHIGTDYWEPPSAPVAAVSGQVVDTRGITGSARLSRDLYALDQYAFRTDERRLQLTETLSLTQLDPFLFQRFRETGVLRFATPTSLFDRRFPGHYLRLIRRVRLSVIALIPPATGIRATLSTTGTSRVVLGAPSFQTVTIPRGPESIALTAPLNSAGVFDLDAQPELLAPFEGLGLDTSWELRLPKPANPFDFETVADVFMAIEYTALDSSVLRERVLREADGSLSADRAFSFRNQFPDAWYDLNHPELVEDPKRRMVVDFTIDRSDFPPHLDDDIRIRNVLLYFAHAGEAFDVVQVKYLHLSGDDRVAATTDADGVVSTGRGNAPGAWSTWSRPFGIWELALSDTAALRARFADGEIQDIVLAVTYEGLLPAWPR